MEKRCSSSVFVLGKVVNCHVAGNSFLSVTLKARDPSSMPILLTCLALNTPTNLMVYRTGNTVIAQGYLTTATEKHTKRAIMTVLLQRGEVMLLSSKDTDIIEKIDDNNPDLVLDQTNMKGQLK